MNKDIHFYATYAAARLAGMPENDALTLAYFCNTTSEYRFNPAYQAPWISADKSITPPATLYHQSNAFPFSGVASNYWDLTHGYSSLFAENVKKEHPKHTHNNSRNIHTGNKYHGAGATFHASSSGGSEGNSGATKHPENHQQRAVKSLIRRANPLTSYFWAGQFDRKHSLRGFFGIPQQTQAPQETHTPSDFIEVDDSGNATYVSHHAHNEPFRHESTAQYRRTTQAQPQKGTVPHNAETLTELHNDTQPQTTHNIIAALNKADSRGHRDLLQHAIYTLGHGTSLAHLGVSIFCYQNSWLNDEEGKAVDVKKRESLDLFALFHGTKRVVEKYLAHQAIPLEGSFNHYFESLNNVAECLFNSGSEEQRCGHWIRFIGDNIDSKCACPWQIAALQYNPNLLLNQLQQTSAVHTQQIIDESAFWQSNFGQHLHALQEIDQWHEILLQNSTRYVA